MQRGRQLLEGETTIEDAMLLDNAQERERDSEREKANLVAGKLKSAISHSSSTVDQITLVLLVVVSETSPSYVEASEVRSKESEKKVDHHVPMKSGC